MCVHFDSGQRLPGRLLTSVCIWVKSWFVLAVVELGVGVCWGVSGRFVGSEAAL